MACLGTQSVFDVNRPIGETPEAGVALGQQVAEELQGHLPPLVRAPAIHGLTPTKGFAVTGFGAARGLRESPRDQAGQEHAH